MPEPMKEAGDKPAAASTPPPPPTASVPPPRSTNSPEHSASDSALSLAAQLPGTSSAPVSPGGTGNDDDVQDDELYYEDDNDSALGGSLIGCETDTLASYIVDYRSENGRQYHAFRDGEYWGPNDEIANELQDLAHHMYLMTLEGRLHLAPIGNCHNILDIGTGTGIWAIDMADSYPSARVIGTDLSPIQPLFVPPNCSFEIEDVNLDWTFPTDHFDFIHIRELFGCVRDWDILFAETFNHMKPGGYIEILEHSVVPISDDGTVDEHSFFTLWGKTVVELGEKFGKSFEIWKESKARIESAGFEDVVETRYKWPMNGWPSPKHRTHGNDGEKSWQKLRELGIWNQLRLHDGIEGFMIRLLTTVGGWSYESAQVFLAQMRAALKDLKVHAYLDVTVVYGRKPGGKPVTPSPTTATKVATPCMR